MTMPITRKQLFKVAKIVRRCAEEMVQNNDRGTNFIDKTDLGGGCGDVSLVLGQLTGLCHCLEAGSYNDAGHYWIRLPDGEIWDLTATQFKVPARIYIVNGDKTKPYSTLYRGKKAIEQLTDWADKNWRTRLRNAVRAELRKGLVI